MTKKILILDQDGHDQRLDAVFQNKFNDPNIRSVHNDTFEDFNQNLNESEWDFVIINFHSPIFWESSISSVKNLVLRVIKHRNKPFRFICFVVLPSLIECLQKNKVLEIRQKTIDLTELRGTLPDTSLLVTETETFSVEGIVEIVSLHTQVPKSKMLLKTRKREVVQARQISMFLFKRYTKMSLKEIGCYFGGRDHTTVIFSCQTVADHIQTNDLFKNRVNLLIEKIEEKFNCSPIPQKEDNYFKKGKQAA